MSRFFFRFGGDDSLNYQSVIYFKFSIGPGLGVGAGAGVGADQKPGVRVESEEPHHDSALLVIFLL